jgi:ADP-ribosylglycohydrolase
LRERRRIRSYAQARAAVDERFRGMHAVHTVNNACLTVWGLTIGGADVTRVIGETVAMGLDNDCTAATAGSIAGAVVGKRGIPSHWYKPFGDRAWSYLNDLPWFSISDLIERFAAQAARISTV